MFRQILQRTAKQLQTTARNRKRRRQRRMFVEALESRELLAFVGATFSWTGDAGYRAEGTFTYDDTFATVIGDGSGATDGLQELTVSFYNPSNGLLGTFDDVTTGTSSYEYLAFTFDTATKTLSGSFDVGWDDFAATDYYLYGTIGGVCELENGEWTWFDDSYSTTITVTVDASATTTATLAGGVLTIADSANRNDAFQIVRNGGNLEITNTGATFDFSGAAGATAITDGFSIPAASVTSLVINAAGGTDDLEIDFGDTDPIPSSGLTFNGGAGGDSLEILNGSFTNQVFDYTGSSADGFAGSIDLDGSVITYTGLEPISGGDSVNTTLNLPDVLGTPNADTVIGAVDADNLQITGSTFENTSIPNPSGSLTVNLGNQGDTLQFQALGANFVAAVTINAGDGQDDVTVVPHASTTFVLDGGDPTAIPGDTVTYDGEGTLTLSGVGAGQIVGTGVQTVDFSHFELIEGASADQLDIELTLPADTNPSGLTIQLDATGTMLQIWLDEGDGSTVEPAETMRLWSNEVCSQRSTTPSTSTPMRRRQTTRAGLTTTSMATRPLTA